MKYSGLNLTKKFQQIAPIQPFLINEPSPGQNTNKWSPSPNSSKQLFSQHVRIPNNGARTNRWDEEKRRKIKTQRGWNAGRTQKPDAWMFDRDRKERKGELDDCNRSVNACLPQSLTNGAFTSLITLSNGLSMAGCWDAVWIICSVEITGIMYKRYLPFFCKTEGRQQGLGGFYDWDNCKTKRAVWWNDAEHLGESGRLTYIKTGSSSIHLCLCLSLLLRGSPSSHSCSQVACLPFSFRSVRERTTYFANTHLQLGFSQSGNYRTAEWCKREADGNERIQDAELRQLQACMHAEIS